MLEELHQQLHFGDPLCPQQNQTIAITAAIIGMGGVGKTELALQYARKHHHLNSYPGGLCWLQARANLGNQIVNFARTYLKLNPPEDIDLPSQVQYCWYNWREGQVLIVLDDVTDYEEIKLYLPPAESRFSLLLTTRQRLGSSIKSFDLEVLSLAAALELLKAIVGNKRIKEELDQAEVLCEWLGYLPLALELVGRYLYNDKTLTLAKVQARLEKKRLAARALCKTEADMTARLGVAAAFELTWSILSEEVKELGCWLSLFAPAPFEWCLVEACLKEWDEEDLEKARNDSLLTWHLLQLTAKHQYVLHPLIRQFFQTKLELMDWANESKSRFCQVMVAEAKKIPQTPTRQKIEIISSVIPHLAEVATTLTNWIEDKDLTWPFVGLGRFYQGQGIYEQAEPWREQCLSLSRDRLGEKHPSVVTSLNNLALLYSNQGRYQQAETFFLQALEMNKQLLGPQHPDVATSLNNLAALYESQGRYSEAEPFYLQALEIYKQLLGEPNLHVANSFNNLALLYKSQGRYSEAEPFYLQALEIYRQLRGPKHPDVTISLNNLAALYHSQGKYSEAEPFYLQALEMTQQLLGAKHRFVATSLNNLALLYQSQGKFQQAEPLCLEALEIYKQLLGPQHPDVATSLNNLAELYRSQGKFQQAEPLFLQALEMYKQLLGPRHPSVGISLNNLAELYKSQAKFQQAEPLYLKALEIYKQLLGEQHPHVAASLYNLALLYYSQGKYSKARPLYQQALDIAERKLGTNHPNTVTFRRNLEILESDSARTIRHNL